MCGIAGFTHFEGPPPGSEAIIRDMCDIQRHRGPDGNGYWTGKGATLGHRRLAIIDVDGGVQPMSNEDGSILVVFNGEIYNYRELRETLEKKGHIFKTRCDTETLVHGYEEWGDELFPKLNGMFAMAVYDDRAKRLVLARDRFGQKPLHYSLLDNNLIFASEIKALLRHPNIFSRRALDLESLAFYLSLEYVPSPRSIIKGIKKLNPGHFLIFDAGGIRVKPYWRLETAFLEQEVPKDPEEVREKFWSLFTGSVKRRLMSDVPLGVFLSGGLDSLAVALAAGETAGSQVETYSIGFQEPTFDESGYARNAANHLGTKHCVHMFTTSEMIRVLPEIIENLDEPMADSSIMPTYLLCQFARRKVTVALSGDGADEFLGGYPTFNAHRIAQRLGNPLGRILKRMGSLIHLIPVSHNQLSFDFRVKWFLRGLDMPAGERLLSWLGAYNGFERNELLHPDVCDSIRQSKDPRRVLTENLNDFRGLRSLSRLYASTYLENDILVKVDRASMFNSLEVRSPFLDHELASYVLALPDRYKLHPRKGNKAILKDALKGKIPAELLQRRKQGFGVPVSEWLSGNLRDWVEDLLDPACLQQEGLFSPKYVRRLLREHHDKIRDNRKFLWPLLIFQAWRRTYLDGRCQGLPGKTVEVAAH